VPLLQTALGFAAGYRVTAATVIAAISIVIAAVSFVVNRWIGQRAAARARKAVLVFVDDPDRECWVLQNVGRAPLPKF
jgi:hypothetical protein